MCFLPCQGGTTGGGGVVGKNHIGAVVCVSCHVREEQRGGGGCREESYRGSCMCFLPCQGGTTGGGL